MRTSVKKRRTYLKIFSLLFSIFIWLYVVSSAEVELDKVVPIVYKLKKGRAILKEVPTEVTFRIKGPRIFVRKLLERKDKIHLDTLKVGGTKRSQYTFNIDTYKIKLPLGLELLDFSPRQVRFKTDKEISKYVPVLLNLDTKVKEEFTLESLNYTPKKIRITGAKAVIRKIKSVETTLIEEVDKTNLNPFEVQINRPGSNLVMEKNSILLNYAAPMNKTEFTISKIPIIFQSSRLIKKRSTVFVNVKVSGDKKLSEEMSKESIQVFANIPTTGKSNITVDLITELPPGVELIELTPKKVSIELESLK